MGGKLHIYKRENRAFWQCSTFLSGKNHRTSTKEISLAKAKDFAEDWYLELFGKHNGVLFVAMSLEKNGGPGRSRTGTPEERAILSRLRLPIPPRGNNLSSFTTCLRK
jgi:hypothetical protein